MRTVGFSTGALARGDYRHALEMLSDKPVTAVELSALRQDELRPLVEDLDNLNLRRFSYLAFHAPSLIDPSFELPAIKLLERVEVGRLLCIRTPCPLLWLGPASMIFCASRMNRVSFG